MARNSLSITTLYSSAQCVLSVVGSVGVILLFAGIPQLIYSPVVSGSNLLTFVMGAVLIMTMVAGNTLLNYKFRRLSGGSENSVQYSSEVCVLDGPYSSHHKGCSGIQLAHTLWYLANGQGGSGDGSEARARDPEDKPPSYDAILTLDGPPPEYSSIILQKPPKYEEIVKETFAACVPSDTATCASPPLRHAEGTPATRSQKKILTLNTVEEESAGDDLGSDEQSGIYETPARSVRPEDEEQGSGEPADRSLPSRDRMYVASGAARNMESQFLDESET
ncbi:uncharacterized protein LOC123516091 isoform X1 [Portunus trituberculatus]|uniref:uncharacterized protein LOC123516091 isoform X1 n=1 Tax=Portunus trituberculatus TaxID=210409 RepID=UPI001E1D09CF|nr:uncharacterized protein LOC123516091 isoform X1 [Portunus trituberculatus]